MDDFMLPTVRFKIAPFPAKKESVIHLMQPHLTGINDHALHTLYPELFINSSSIIASIIAAIRSLLIALVIANHSQE